jgi:hypothetical protein
MKLYIFDQYGRYSHTQESQYDAQGTPIMPLLSTVIDPGVDPHNKKWNGEEWVEVPVDETVQAKYLRDTRNKRLAESDVMVMTDRWDIMSAENKVLWTNYRQSLRDVTKQEGFPQTVVWPVKP